MADSPRRTARARRRRRPARSPLAAVVVHDLGETNPFWREPGALEMRAADPGPPREGHQRLRGRLVAFACARSCGRHHRALRGCVCASAGRRCASKTRGHHGHDSRPCELPLGHADSPSPGRPCRIHVDLADLDASVALAFPDASSRFREACLEYAAATTTTSVTAARITQFLSVRLVFPIGIKDGATCRPVSRGSPARVFRWAIKPLCHFALASAYSRRPCAICGG